MQTDTTRENPQGTLPQATDSNSDLSAPRLANCA